MGGNTGDPGNIPALHGKSSTREPEVISGQIGIAWQKCQVLTLIAHCRSTSAKLAGIKKEKNIPGLSEI